MIKAMIFDLDGTLVQTEALKSLSYWRAAQELSSSLISQAQFSEDFKAVVGLSRREVAMALLDRYGLVKVARAQMPDYEVDAPWQVYVQIRLRHYEEMLNDPAILRDSIIPHNVALLKDARRTLKTGLATMSYCPQVRHVLRVLDLDDHFHFVASRDDVENGKPDPEIYHLVGCELMVEPHECLVIEDSATGVKAVLNAGMHCIAVTTELTHEAVHKSNLLDRRWIVDDPAILPFVVGEMTSSQA